MDGCAPNSCYDCSTVISEIKPKSVGASWRKNKHKTERTCDIISGTVT